MKAILHIGTEKTGTTTLQALLASNRDTLRQRGVAFTRSGGNQNDRDLAAYAVRDDHFDDDRLIELGITDLDSKLRYKSDVAARFTEEIEGLREGCDTVILSSEHFQSRLRSTFEIRVLKDLLSSTGLEVTKVLVYLRSPAEIIHSMYSTQLRNGSFAAPSEAADKEQWNHICDHERTLRQWSSAFGQGTMLPRLYVPSRFVGGDLITDFCQATGIDLAGLELPEHRNRSLTPRGQEVLRRLNRRIPIKLGTSANPLHREVVLFVNKHFSGVATTPSPSLVKSANERFAGSNEWVRQRYFPRLSTLFPEPWDGGQEGLAPRYLPARRSMTPTEEPLGVLVMGMHRSGTSAVAGALRAAGLFGGAPAAYIPPNSGNPAGFWERQDVQTFNDRLLDSLGWAWDRPPPVPPKEAAPRPSFVAEGRHLVAGIARGVPYFIKDPRLSLLLPWWRQIMRDRFVPVVVIRPPEDVARSLEGRDHLPPAIGTALSSAYRRHLVEGLAGMSAIVVEYPALVADPESGVRDLLGRLERRGLPGPYDLEAAVASIQPPLPRVTGPGPVEVARLESQAPEPWEAAILDMHSQGIGHVQRAEEAERSAAAARAEADAALIQAESARLQALTAADESRQLAVRVAHLEAEVESLRAAAAARKSARAPISALLTWGGASLSRRLPQRLRLQWKDGRLRRVAENPLFDAQFYLSRYPDVREAGLDPRKHYWSKGAKEGRDPNAVFETGWYLRNNPDVAGTGMNALDHYWLFGAAEGRDPSPRFASAWYLQRYPDVRASGMSPLLHYLTHGVVEKRRPTPESAETTNAADGIGAQQGAS